MNYLRKNTTYIIPGEYYHFQREIIKKNTYGLLCKYICMYVSTIYDKVVGISKESTKKFDLS